MTGQTVPLSDALEALIASGNHEAAAALALRASKREALSTAPDEPATRDYLTRDELESLDLAGVARLRTEHPETYAKSLAMVGQKPAPAVQS
jgi:hypothetical protein